MKKKDNEMFDGTNEEFESMVEISNSMKEITNLSMKLTFLRESDPIIFTKALILMETQAESEQELDHVYSRSLETNLPCLLNPIYHVLARNVENKNDVDFENPYRWMH